MKYISLVDASLSLNRSLRPLVKANSFYLLAPSLLKILQWQIRSLFFYFLVLIFYGSSKKDWLKPTWGSVSTEKYGHAFFFMGFDTELAA